MNAIKNLTDVLSNSLTTTLDVEYKGYLQYVQILKRLENMPPLEFTYYDDLNVPRMLKVPPITLVPLTMLHIKRASFDYSVAVDKLDSLAETGKLEPSPALDEAKKNAKNNCNYTEYTLDSSGQYKVSSKGKTSLIQVGVFSESRINAANKNGRSAAAALKNAAVERVEKHFRGITGVAKRNIADIELRRMLSSLKSYYGKPFVLMDGTFYIPKLILTKGSDVQKAYTFDGISASVKGSIPSGYQVMFCPLTNQVFRLLSDSLANCVQYSFYQDGSALSAAGEKLEPVPSTGDRSPIFSISFNDGSTTLLCQVKVYYGPEIETKIVSKDINIKSEKRTNCNLKVTVKMGQAGISQGVISLLNSKNKTNLK